MIVSQEYSRYPRKDLEWLKYVSQFNKILEDYPEFEPLRREIYDIIFNNQCHINTITLPLRKSLSRLKQKALSLYLNLHLRKADIIIWQDIQREHLFRSIRIIRDLLHKNGIKTLVLSKPSINPKGFLHGYLKIGIGSSKQFPEETLDFIELLMLSFKDSVTNRHIKKVKDSISIYVNYKYLFLSIIKRVKPKTVIFMYDQYLPSATLIQVCRENGIKTYSFQHGAAIPLQSPVQADKLLVWGCADRDYFHNLGVPDKRMIICGSILHDDLVFNKNTRKRKYKLLLVSNGNDPQRNGKLPQIGYDWFCSLKSKFGNKFEYYVRYHPREKEYYKKYAQKFDLTFNDINLDEAINAVDIVIGYVSTVLVESALVGRPVIQITQPDEEGLCDFYKDNVTIRIKTYDEFEDTIDSLTHDELAYTNRVDIAQQNIHRYFYNHPNVKNNLMQLFN